MNIQEIGQALLNELQEELNKSNENATLAKGAIQGVQMFFTRMQAAQQQEVASAASENTKSTSKGKKSKK